MSERSEFACLVPFPDQSNSFVHGFEAGMIWNRMEAGETPIDFTGMPLHSENRDVLQRMAAARGYDLRIESDRDGWITGTFEKKRRSFSVVAGGRGCQADD